MTAPRRRWPCASSRPAPSCGWGGFSYSYYLVHDPTLNVLRFALTPYRFSPATVLGVMLVACIPLSANVAYLFHLVFERPFLSGFPRAPARATPAAVLSPAP